MNDDIIIESSADLAGKYERVGKLWMEVYILDIRVALSRPQLEFSGKYLYNDKIESIIKPHSLNFDR